MIEERKRPTIWEVARCARVSIATVSHVLNRSHHVSRELCLRVEEAIGQLDYQPNHIGRCLRKGNSGTVALIVADIRDPFFPEIIRGVEDFFGRHRYGLFLCNTDEDPSKEKLCLRDLESRQVDGVIIAPAIGQHDIATILKRIKTPSVIIDRELSDVYSDQIFSDNIGGGYQATAHLLSLGHKIIGLILPNSKIASIEDRVMGYQMALEKYGVDLDKNIICKGEFGIEGGYKAAKTLLRTNPEVSAIFSTNDSMTLGVMLLLKDEGIKCPKQLSIVGFDDPPWARAFSPTLTVVTQQTYQMGYEGANLLWQRLSSKSRIKEPRKIKLETFLRIGESTRLNF